MQSFSAMNFTAIGGSSRCFGVSPIASSSRRNGLHHLFSVFTLTPALSASSDFVIALILLRNCFLTTFHVKTLTLFF